MEQKDKVNKIAGNAIKKLIEFCINEKILNPRITIEAKTTDGENYRLIFERTDVPQRDDLFQDCVNYLKTKKTISCADLQHKFHLGYNRSGMIMDQLEDAEIIAPFEGSKERRVLILEISSISKFKTTNK